MACSSEPYKTSKNCFLFANFYSLKTAKIQLFWLIEICLQMMLV